MALDAESMKQAPLPKNTVVVARADGRLYTVDFTENPQLDDASAIDWGISVSKLIVGKIQQTRTRLLTLEEISVENITHTLQPLPGNIADTVIAVSGALDGKNESFTKLPTVSIDEGGLVEAKCRVTATNFAIQLTGTYNINTIQVTVHQNGRR